MANLPTVAIIGKPNTGKSTLFNRLVGKRRAIVSDIPGTTRDQVAQKVETDSVDYLLIDTGGIGGGSQDSDLEENVEKQSLLALENADVIVLTLNSKEDLTASDFAVASVLRKNARKHVPIIVVLTKCDNAALNEEILPRFYELNIGEEILPISATHNMGMDELTGTIEDHLQSLHFGKQESSDDEKPRIAMIGKPNVGKSSLINAFLSEGEREKSGLIVSDIAGTTRDTSDRIIRYHDQEYVFTDTAGIKRRKSTDEGIETFAALRSLQAVEECDICILVLDANEPVSKQDKRIASLAVQSGKGLIIVLNKIDTLKGEKRKEAVTGIQSQLFFCSFAPFLSVSAVSKEGLLKLFDLIEMVHKNRTRRIATKDLRNWYEQTVPSQHMGELMKSKHLTQADEIPPTFILFVRDPKKIQASQLKYLENRMRKAFGFEGTPIRWITKK